ncbi:ribonuclease H-like domain-containing protein [Rhizophagus clarus]|uniref:Ribonuclease H-like domain-containing protein n=1 Tax=Rhizophagus clarus TaxID=94130 RepID=A0A8H3M1B7_9GLOM|nr:ribonuclease H-like domain-containing protein [Rhizophagus clarus]
MIIALYIDSDKQTKNDGKWLKDINLIKDEWNAISELVPILESFANATELSDNSQYVIVSFMYPTINIIIRSVKSSNFNINEVGAVKINTLQDCKNLILKVKNALYEFIIYYWNILKDYGLIAILLDSRYKSLSFIFSEFHNDIYLKLRSIYNEKKLEYSKQKKKYHEKYLINLLLASMFSRKYECGDEVTEYLRVEEISFSECPFN